MEKVLVTGATGYIGLHCIHQLLNKGYAVNGSVRSPERKDEIIQALKSHNTSTEHLNLFTFNLTEDAGWDEAMAGCDYLLHVASPISLERTDEDYFVKPAIDGVNRALAFAKKFKVMYWTLELASKLEDAPWPANKDELIDFAIRSGAPMEVVENLQELEDDGEMFDSIEDIWPDYPDKDDFFFNEDEY